MHVNAQVVEAALRRLGVDADVRELDGSCRTATEAAETLGTEVGAIVNSLVFMAGDEPVLILTSGAHRVDLALVAEAEGLPALRRASPDEVRVATGQPIGGVSPVGHPAPVRSFVDQDLARFGTVWAAAGTPHSVFPTTYDQLLAITGGTPVRVSSS